MVTKVFDRSRVFASRARAARAAKQYAFLHERALGAVQDRLLDVRREFETVLVIGTFHGSAQMAAWLKQHKGAKHVITMDAALPDTHVRADEEALPFGTQSLDLVIAAGTLHGVNDLPGALVQIRRALKPDGLFMGVMAGGETLYELRESIVKASEQAAGGFTPRVHPLVSLQVMAGLLQRAGFALPVADSEVTRVSYRSLKTLLKDLKGMGESLALDRTAPPAAPGSPAPAPQTATRFTGRHFWQAVEDDYRSRYSDDAGHLQASFELLYALGWAPHESQPKPLERGTATMRLEDALNTPKQ